MINLNSKFYFLLNEAGEHRGVVALCGDEHDSAIGGCRIIQKKFSPAIVDLSHHLAETMRLKAKANQLPLNGAKAVICANDSDEKKYLLRQLANVLNELKGRYITAVDMGITQEDMDYLSQFTDYLTCDTHSGGDPSFHTARGIFVSMEAAFYWFDKNESLVGKHIVIQGIGKVGYALLNLLLNAGAKVSVSDANPEAFECLVDHPNVTMVDNQRIHELQCDIFAPCAASEMIDEDIVKSLQCRMILGAANNPLSGNHIIGLLKKKNIVYFPDYLVNGGGLIHCLHQRRGDFDLDEKVNAIKQMVLDYLRTSE